MLTQERNMKELRGNESPKPCISHSKLLKNTQKCFDILPRAHSAGKAGRDGQAERLLGFLIPSNSHVNHPGTWPPGLVKQHITCSLSRCNIFPLAGYRKAEPHTIWLHKISLDAKSLPLLQARWEMALPPAARPGAVKIAPALMSEADSWRVLPSSSTRAPPAPVSHRTMLKTTLWGARSSLLMYNAALPSPAQAPTAVGMGGLPPAPQKHGQPLWQVTLHNPVTSSAP